MSSLDNNPESECPRGHKEGSRDRGVQRGGRTILSGQEWLSGAAQESRTKVLSVH